jgi:hypothetical protein
LLVSKYLPTIDHSLWPCAILLLIFIPVSIWHDRNWRRTLSAYAEARRAAGADGGEWPSAGLRRLMGVQPGLVLAATALLAAMTAFATWAVVQWPYRPYGFDLSVNIFDLPYLWCAIVAGCAAVVAGIAVTLDLARSPWAFVARQVRRSMYLPAEERAKRFEAALAVDPGVPHEADAPQPPAAAPAEPQGPAAR